MKLPQLVLSGFARVALAMPPAGKPLVRAVLEIVGMPRTARFADYVIDFERSYEDDDWSRIERYFAPDAVYEVRNSSFDCRLEGPRSIIEGFKCSLDGFDRQLRRSLRIQEGPHERDNLVTFVWVGRYTRPGAPPLVISARQSARYRDGLIIELCDEYLPDSGDRIAKWLDQHGEGLNPAYTGASCTNESTNESTTATS